MSQEPGMSLLRPAAPKRRYPRRQTSRGWFPMNWEAIGAVSETLGAIRVIASLVYLATQLRNNAVASAFVAYVNDEFLTVRSQ